MADARTCDGEGDNYCMGLEQCTVIDFGNTNCYCYGKIFTM